MKIPFRILSLAVALGTATALVSCGGGDNNAGPFAFSTAGPERYARIDRMGQPAVGTALLSIPPSILLMFPIGGIAYELQRFLARFVDHPLAQILLAPGFLVQRITTAEPTDDQVEIALVALRQALANEAAAPVAVPVTEPSVRTFPSFAAFATEHGL